MSEITMVLSGYEKERIENRVAELLADKIDAELGDHLREQTRALIEEKVRELAETEARKAVAEILAAGWRTTNSYGEPTGVSVTFKERVSQILFERRGYNSTPKIDEICREEMNKALQGELGKILKEASDKLKAAVDETISAKLRETLKGALGLR